MRLFIAALACLISVSVFGQCVDVSYSISAGSYPSEISWYIMDADGNEVVSGGADESGVLCLDIDCFTFVGMDAAGDGWDGAIASFI